MPTVPLLGAPPAVAELSKSTSQVNLPPNVSEYKLINILLYIYKRINFFVKLYKI